MLRAQMRRCGCCIVCRPCCRSASKHDREVKFEHVVEDVDKAIALFAFPSSNSTPHCALPDNHGLKKGEKYAMMDSGAGCHTADARKEFAKHRHRKGSKVRKCVLADGTPKESDEVVDVKVGIQ